VRLRCRCYGRGSGGRRLLLGIRLSRVAIREGAGERTFEGRSRWGVRRFLKAAYKEGDCGSLAGGRWGLWIFGRRRLEEREVVKELSILWDAIAWSRTVCLEAGIILSFLSISYYLYD
jgi:hypothetical protein